jgi:hypothetical protein
MWTGAPSRKECSTHVGDMKLTKKSWKISREENGDMGANGSIILKRILKTGVFEHRILKIFGNKRAE